MKKIIKIPESVWISLVKSVDPEDRFTWSQALVLGSASGNDLYFVPDREVDRIISLEKGED